MYQNNLPLVAICLTISMMCLAEQLFSSHIVGGEITYEFLNYNSDQTEVTYQVTLFLYRDPSSPTAYETVTDFGVYVDDSSGIWRPYKVISEVPRGEITEITRGSDPCKTRIYTETSLQSTTYTFQVTLEVGDNNYMISYQRCCRNYTISNIDPNGAVYDTYISSLTLRNGNSSPVFKELPPIFVCSGYDLIFDHSAIDKEGDELRYSFCTALFSGYNDGSGSRCCGCVSPDPNRCPPPYLDVVYIDPYSPKNPMGGDPQITIDPASGLICGVPEINDAYVVAVCVEEYRDGILLSKIRRDFEFNVVECFNNLTASVASDSIQVEDGHDIAYFESCNELEFLVTNTSTVIEYIDNYSWEVWDSEGAVILDENGPDLRDNLISIPSPGSYDGHMYISDNDLCQDTAKIRFVIRPQEISYLEVALCPDDDVLFNGTRLTLPGTYLDTLSDIYNCDSLVSLTITPIMDMETRIADRFCAGDAYIYDGESILIPGNYEYVYSTSEGCDSTVYLALAQIEPALTELSLILCNESHYLIGSDTITVDGLYQYQFTAANGCDSIVNLDITFRPPSIEEILDTICHGEIYLFGNEELRVDGIYYEQVQNQYGCDSLTILNLTVGNNLTRIMVDEELTLEFGENIIIEPEIIGGDLIASTWYEVDQILSESLVLSYVIEKDDWLFFESTNLLFCVAIDSVFIRAKLNKDIYIPNVLSTSAAGHNNVFNIGGSETMVSSRLSIYDRWGNKIYQGPHTTDKQITAGWDGTYNNTPVQPGNYAYMVEVIFVDESKKIYTGNITVVE